jgi:hypothetical protein
MTEPGPLADEAQRLVEAGLAWAQRLVAAVDPAGERLATGAPECGACPICRAVAALRDPSPEVTERITATVTDLATLVATGLRTLDGHLAHPHGSFGDDPQDVPRPGARRRNGGSGVEHIDIA